MTDEKKMMEFHALVQELKKWLEERDLHLGYTDTYLGHLALLIQEKEAQARAEERKAVAEEVKRVKPHHSVFYVQNELNRYKRSLLKILGAEKEV